VEVICDHAEALSRLLTLFAPHVGEGAAPAVRVEIAAGERTYPVPTQARRVLSYGRVRSYFWADRHYFTDYASTLCVGENGTLVQGNLSPRTLREKEGLALFVDSLLCLALFEALRHHDLFYLHAGAVRGPDGCGYLISGNAGSGKTSLTLSLIQAGFQFLSDDTVFLRPAGETEVEALGVARDFHVARDLVREAPSLGRLDSLPEYNHYSGKLRLRPDEWFAGARIDRIFNPDVILFSKVGAAATELVPMNPMEALTSLLPQSVSVMFDPRLAGRHLETLRRVVDRARAFRARLGAEMKGDPRRARELVEQARDRAGKD
jgi:hypothetical protein